ncbi:hypothetical protein FRB93_003281 [Tulasnella sp. JGI-2019a]|nr:hypothetical protein FRB93_003281 [Tulasnella sp. JGI-2019a]
MPAFVTISTEPLLPRVRKSSASAGAEPTGQASHAKQLQTTHIPSDEAATSQRLHNRTENDLAVLYDSETSCASQTTQLSQKIHALDKNESILYHGFFASQHAFRDLGPMAADLVWLQWYTSILRNMPGYANSNDDSGTAGYSYVASVIANVVGIIRPETTRPLLVDLRPGNVNVSRKFVKLCDILKVLAGDPAFRGVIIVQYRFTALLLAAMIPLLAPLSKTIRAQVLLSSGRNDDPQSMDSLTQHGVLEDFQKGNVNTLLVTSEAEFCFDLSPVNHIIRWDVPDDCLSYAHSRAWLNQPNGTCLTMCEKGNRYHARVMWQLKDTRPEWLKWIQSLRQGTTHVPPSVMLFKDYFDHHALHEETDREEAFFIDPVTSAKLYSSDSVRVVYQYATRMSTFQNGDYGSGVATRFLFHYESTGDVDDGISTRCHIRFPDASPLRYYTGPSCAARADARRLACFLVCQELYQRCLLKPTDWPTPARIRIPIIDSSGEEEGEDLAPVSVASKGGKRARNSNHMLYPHIRCEFWRHTLSASPLRLFPTVFALQGPGSGPCRPVCIMTRLPLLSIEPFSIGPLGYSRKVHLQMCDFIDVVEEELVNMHQFTTLLCRTVYRKPVALRRESSPCLFAPLTNQWSETHFLEDGVRPMSNMRDFVAWEEIKRIVESMNARPRLSVNSLTAMVEDTKDVLIQENSGPYAALFEVTSVSVQTSDLLNSQVAVNDPNIVKYLESGCLDGDAGAVKRYQPLMQVSSTLVHDDYFRHAGKLEIVTKYVIPELCFKHPMSASLLRTAIALPSVLVRIDDMMVAKQLNATIFENKIDDSKLTDALTASSAERGRDYERFELLGDTILKYVISAYLLVYFPHGGDGVNKSKSMTEERNRLVANAMLLKIMRESGIPAYIRADSVVTGPGDRIAPGLQLGRELQHSSSASAKQEGLVRTADSESPLSTMDTGFKHETKARRLAERTETQFLGNKTVSDVCEAILGAAWLSGGLELTLKCLKRFGLPMKEIDRWSDLGKHARMPDPPDEIRISQSVINEIQGIIGVRLARPELLAWALTHGSATSQGHTPHQWLEFVGDGFLDYLVVPDIYETHQDLGPGPLTLLKSTMVSTEVLAALCVDSGIADHFVYRSTDLAGKLTKYTKTLGLARSHEYLAASNEDRLPRRYWKGIKPPKELADCFESLLGAILVSEGFDSRGGEVMYRKVIKPFYDRHVHLEDVTAIALSVLREKLSEKGCKDLLIRRTTRAPKVQGGPPIQQCDIMIHGVVIASAQADSQTTACNLAEALACNALDGLFITDCYCRIEGKRPNVQARRQRRAAERINEELEEDGVVERLLGDLSSDPESEVDDDEGGENQDDDEDIDGVGIIEEDQVYEEGDEGESEEQEQEGEEGGLEQQGSDMEVSD